MANEVELKDLVIKYRKIFVKNRWANSTSGGVAMMNSDSGHIHYLPSTIEHKFNAKHKHVKVEMCSEPNAKDDLCSGFWADGFGKYGIVGIGHIVSIQSIVISLSFDTEIVFEFKNQKWFEVMKEHCKDGKYRLPVLADSPKLSEQLSKGIKCCDQAKPLKRVDSTSKISPKTSEPVEAEPSEPSLFDLSFGWKCDDPAKCVKGGVSPSAVLVKNRGLFVFGPTIALTIKRCEALQMMFELHEKTEDES